MKRRSLTVLLCLLAIISLASVGFASWVISAGDTEELEGNIQVETVSDQRLSILITQNLSATSFVFGKPTDFVNDNSKWLKANDVPNEVLSTKFSFKVSSSDESKELIYGSANGNTKLQNVWVKVEFDDATKTLLEGAKNAGFIKDVPTMTMALPANDVNNTTTFTDVTFTFEWGSTFGGMNPYKFYNEKVVNDGYYKNAEGEVVYYVVDKDTANPTYYNSLDYTDANKIDAGSVNLADLTFVSWGDDAVTKLEALYNQFYSDGAFKQFTIVITASPEPFAQQN